jgi:hypothetical protein
MSGRDVGRVRLLENGRYSLVVERAGVLYYLPREGSFDAVLQGFRDYSSLGIPMPRSTRARVLQTAREFELVECCPLPRLDLRVLSKLISEHNTRARKPVVAADKR